MSAYDAGMRRWLPAVVLLAFVAVWAVKGAHWGYTRDSEFVETPDPVTGLTKLTPRDVWIPGVDFLALGVGAAILLFVALKLIQRKR